MKLKLEDELATLEKLDPLEGLEMNEADRKGYYEAKRLREKGHNEAVEALKGQIRSQDDSVNGTDGELQRIYNITYHNRVKYDFLKTYRPSKSYVEK